MSTKIGDHLTPVTPLQFMQGLAQGWVNLFTTPPTTQELFILMAQSTIECGRGWRYIHRYNFGNVKSVDGDGRDYCYFACWEIFSKPVAAAYVANSKPGAVARITDNHSNGTCTVWFDPEHPACRFRAYCVLKNDGSEDSWSSLVLGMTDYLGLLYKRFNKSWEALKIGDPEAFVRALKVQGYFTADVEDYVKSVTSLVHEFGHLNVDISSLPIIPTDKLPLITELSQVVKQEYMSDLSELEQT